MHTVCPAAALNLISISIKCSKCTFTLALGRYVKVAAKQVTSCAFGGPNLVSYKYYIFCLDPNFIRTYTDDWKSILFLYINSKPNYQDTLYITSASCGLSAEDRAQSPLSGEPAV